MDQTAPAGSFGLTNVEFVSLTEVTVVRRRCRRHISASEGNDEDQRRRRRRTCCKAGEGENNGPRRRGDDLLSTGRRDDLIDGGDGYDTLVLFEHRGGRDGRPDRHGPQAGAGTTRCSGSRRCLRDGDDR